MLPKHILTAASLVTPRTETVRGFISQARQKKAITSDILSAVQTLTASLEKVKTVAQLKVLLKDEEVRYAFTTAAGLSDKAKGHLSEKEQDSVIEQVFGLTPKSDVALVCREILYGYLLTKGDALGGSIRNWIGAEAGRRLVGRILSVLDARRIKYSIQKSIAMKVVEIRWPQRILLFDRKPRFIQKSVDIILLRTDNAKTASPLEEAECYLACGELKGGIDPAGADEHWKTAGSAFDRIREAFQNKRTACPSLFFVGAAIEEAMAGEIFRSLSNGTITHAANLTQDDQLTDLVDWLVAL